MAKLPETLIKKPKPELGDIEIGHTVFLEPSAMQPDLELVCFLNPRAQFQRKKSILHILCVKRMADGFHVSVLGHHRWLPRNFEGIMNGWLPVASIVED